MQPGEPYSRPLPDIGELTGPVRDPADAEGELRSALGLPDAGPQRLPRPGLPDVHGLAGELGLS